MQCCRGAWASRRWRRSWRSPCRRPSLEHRACRGHRTHSLRAVASTRGVQFAGLAHHFLNFSDMLFLKLDLLAGIFLKPHALVNYELEQGVVLAKRGTLVVQGLLQNLNDVVLVGLDQLANFQRWMAAERSDVLAGDRGVAHALG